MGKGDKKTKRGKILMGSYGVRRPRRKAVNELPVAVVKVEDPVKVQKEKPAPKPKAVTEEIKAVTPEIEVTAEVAEKPAKKKSTPKPKASAKKETKPE